MKATLQSIYANPKYAKAFEWGKLITITGGAQIIIQAIGLVSGILVIRLLPTEEYALYTIANTMLGTMTLLADGGISTGVMAEGGKVWQDRQKLGAIMVTGLDLRKKFAIGSLLVVSPVLFYLLTHHGASPLMATLIVLSVIPAFLTSLLGTLLQIVPRLHQKVAALQENQLKSNGIRFVLSIVSIFVFPFASIAILSAGIPQVWANYDLRKITNPHIDWSQKVDSQIQKKILSYVKKMLPGAIYYSFLGQITIWLISIFGTTTGIAQIGALGRLAVLMNVLNVMFATLIVPRFARIKENRELLLIRFLQIQAALLIVGLGLVTLTYLTSPVLLSILGADYLNLNSELMLTMIGSYLSLMSGISYALCTNRGWVLSPIISTVISATSIIIGIKFFNISTMSGILLLNVFISIVHVILFSMYGIQKIIRLKAEIIL